MKKSSKVTLLAVTVTVTVTVLVLEAPVAAVVEGVNCSPLEMSSCLPAIIYGTAPSETCCNKPREQKPCLCGYLKDPNLRSYVNSPNARAVASKCAVPFPKCSSTT